MAKICPVCKQSYGDEHSHCPHCAAHQAGDSGLDLGADLPRTGEGGSSSGSFDWNEVSDVPEPSASQPPASPPPTPTGGKATQFSTGQPGQAPDDDIMEDPVHPLPPPAGQESSSVIDLGGPMPGSEAGRPSGSGQGLSDSDLLGRIPAEEPPPGALASPPSDILSELAESPPGQPAPPAGSPDDELVGELFPDDEVSLAGHSSAQEHDKPDDSAIDLGALSQARSPEQGSSREELFVAELASDASRVDQVRDVPSSPSPPPRAPAPEPVHEPEVVEAIEAEEAAEAEPEVGEAAEAAEAEPEVVEAAEVESGGELEDIFGAPELGPEAAEPFAGSSVRPVSADSSINLDRTNEPPAAPADSGLALDFFLSQSSKSSQVPPAAEGEEAEEVAEVDEEGEMVLDAAQGSAPRKHDSKAEAADAAEMEDFLAREEHAAEVAEEEEPVAADEEPVAADEEEAVAAVEEEEAAAEEEERPKPPRQRSRVPAFVGGGLLGLLAGVGAWAGLVLGGLDPAPKLQELTGKAPPPKTAGPGAGGPMAGGAGGPAKPTLQQQMEWVQSGEYQKARESGYEQAEAASPQELARRGEYRWLSYLQEQRKTGKPVQLTDPAVKAAQEDLQKAAKDVPEALYWLGHISEVGKQPDQAKQYYSQGLQQFNDPIEKVRFQAALDRLGFEGGHQRGAFLVPSDPKQMARLALILVALQQPGGQQPPPGQVPPPGQPPAGQPQAGQPQPQEATEEAGSSFWQALRQARAQDFDAAIKAIDQAKKVHDDRRYLRLRKAQNPLTDPTEEIFLRACEELHAYWQLEAKLQADGYWPKGQSAEQALTNLGKRIQQGAAADYYLSCGGRPGILAHYYLKQIHYCPCRGANADGVLNRKACAAG
jgi:tetratricopeptide (TPR) repeat protein